MWCFWPPFWTRKKSLRFRNRKIAGNPSGFIPTVQSQRGSLAAELDREPLAAATATGRDDLATATGGHTGAEAVRTGAADVVGLVGALHRDVPWVTRRLRRRGSGNCPRTSACEQGDGSIPADLPPVKRQPARRPVRGPAIPLMSPRSLSSLEMLRLHSSSHHQSGTEQRPPPHLFSPHAKPRRLRDRSGGETRLSVRPSRRLHKPTSAPRPTQSRLPGEPLYHPPPQHGITLGPG